VQRLQELLQVRAQRQEQLLPFCRKQQATMRRRQPKAIFSW
jgi:hypothetical protein